MCRLFVSGQRVLVADIEEPFQQQFEEWSGIGCFAATDAAIPMRFNAEAGEVDVGLSIQMPSFMHDDRGGLTRLISEPSNLHVM